MTTTELEPYQQRVVTEKAELDERLSRLRAFIESLQFAALPPPERARQQKQAVFMEAYATVLGERIAAFKSSEPAAKRYTRFDVHCHMVQDDVPGWSINVFLRMNDGKEFTYKVSFLELAGFHEMSERERHEYALKRALAFANGETP